MLKMFVFEWPKARRVRQLALLLVTVLSITSSTSMAKSRKTVHQYANPVAAVPEDPQAYAMRIARQTWPGRALCDEGGYRIRPCDIGDLGR
jgi:Tfp pilus assembly protein FimV